MSKWIRWTQWTEAGMVNFGQMPARDVEKCLQDFEHQAKEVLKETGADHVLYGVKGYDLDGDLNEVRFYMIAMDDERFQKEVASKAGVTVYALHKRK